MSTKKRGLGRGLEALLGSAASTVAISTEAEEGAMRQIPVDVIRRGKYQPYSL